MLAIFEDCNSDLVDDYIPTPRSMQTRIVATTYIQDWNTALDGDYEKEHQIEEMIFNREKEINANLKKNESKNFGSITTLYGLTGVPVTQEQMIWSGLAS